MEIAIAVFIGLWISLSAWIANRYIKREYENMLEKKDK